MKNKRLFNLLILLFVVIIGLTASGLSDAQNNISNVIKAYRSYKEVGNVALKVPTVLEVSFADEFLERYDFAVLNKTTNAFEPHFFKQQVMGNETAVSISTVPLANSPQAMLDGKADTYAEFSLPEAGQGTVLLNLRGIKPFSSSMLTLLLDQYVAMPNTVEIRAEVDGKSEIVVATKQFYEQTIRFPKTTSSDWLISLTFSQPLRISELRLQQDDAQVTSQRAIRFLAQPENQYRIYFDPDRYSPAPVGEAGDLSSSDRDVLRVSAGQTQTNPNFSLADVDGDGVADVKDNCVNVPNAEQDDIDNNGRGDSCDDWDRDGIINSADNCVKNPNSGQADTDGDKKGDACDGEESRVTEKHKWIPWASLILAALVVMVLLFFTIRSKPHKPEDPTQQPPAAPQNPPPSL